MLGHKEYDYSSVEGEEEEAFLSNDASERNERQPSKLSWLLYATVMVTSLLTGIVIGYNSRSGTVEKGLTFADTSHLRLCKNLLSKSPAYKAKILDNGINFETHEQRFNGSLFKRSAYSGPPTPEMDQTWGRFTEAGSSMLVKITEGPLFCSPASFLTTFGSRNDARLSSSTEHFDRRCASIHKLSTQDGSSSQ